jgi:hypothetical protein
LAVRFQDFQAGLFELFAVFLQASQHGKCVRDVIAAKFDGVGATGSLFLGGSRE